MTLREQIVSEIMKLVKPAMVPMMPKPSIEELEKILNSENPRHVQILPDGSIMEEGPAHTVGDIADAVLRIVGDVRYAALCQAREKVQAECQQCCGSGHAPESTPDNPHQCMYCGYPMDAIKKLIR